MAARHSDLLCQHLYCIGQLFYLECQVTMTQKNSFRALIVTLISGCVCLSGCTAGIPLMATATPPMTKVIEQVTGTPNDPTPVAMVVNPPEMHLTLPSGLRIDEYALKARPDGEPLVFEPVQGSQDAVLARHETERQEKLSDTFYFDNTSSSFESSALLENQKLIARLIESGTTTSIYHPLSIEVILNGKTIYTMPAGVSSPTTTLQRVWTYDKHLVFEASDVEMSPSHTIVGKIVQDGKLLNEQLNYQEAFGFQVFKDKSFYFFKRNDYFGISYDGQETLLDYADVPHYNCCSLAALDSRRFPNMGALFCREHSISYYVESGKIE